MSQRIHLDATPGLFHQVLHCHQGDVGRQFEIAVVTRDGYEIPSGATFKIQATKPSGLGFTVTGTAANNVISFTSTEDMTSEAGEIPTQLEIKSGNDVIYASNFLLVCEKNTHPSSVTDGSPEEIISEITLLVERAESAASTAGADAAAAAQARVDEMMDYLPSEVANLKSDLNFKVNGNTNVTAGKNLFDLKTWLSRNEISYTESDGAIVFTPRSTISNKPYVLADDDIEVVVNVSMSSTGHTYLIFRDKNGTNVLTGSSLTNKTIKCSKILMNWSSGKETTAIVSVVGVGKSNDVLAQEIEPLVDKVQNSIDLHSFNLLDGLTPSEQTLLNYSDGTTSASTGFFTFQDIDISGYIGGLLHTYNSIVPNTYYSRFCFYDADHTFISGKNPNESNGIGTYIPLNAKYLSICFNYADGDYKSGKPDTYWASLLLGDLEVTKIGEDVRYNKNSDIFMPYKGKRKPTVTIVMDGDFTNNAYMVGIAEKHNLRIGFGAPFLTDRFVNNGLELYKTWQENGHELGVHGLYNIGTGSPYTEEEIAEKIKEAYDEGIARGYDLHGYVAYQGNSVASSREVIKKYFDYSFSMANHSGAQSAPNNEPCMYIGRQTPYTMFRYSMETSTLQQQKDAIDRCIATEGFLCLYGHSDNEGGNFTRENFDALCAYIVGKIENDDIYFDTPYKAIQEYFTPRYSDTYETLIDIASNITVDSRFSVISQQIMFDVVKKICYVNLRIRASQAVSGSNITFATGFPYPFTSYYASSNRRDFSICFVDGYCKTLDSVDIANGSDIYISAAYYSPRDYA